jgi:mRNA-degrading endonuclease RelE of RelBE toxin-antitoxin system
LSLHEPNCQEKTLEAAKATGNEVVVRIGEYRVFYDVDEETSTVTIRAVRSKPPHKTTEEIL